MTFVAEDRLVWQDCELPELIALEQKKAANTAADQGHGGKAESTIAAEHGSDVGQQVAKPTRVRRKVSLTKSPNGRFPHIPY